MILISFDFEGTMVNFQWDLDRAVEDVIAAMLQERINRGGKSFG